MDLQLPEGVCCIAQTACELRRLVCALNRQLSWARPETRCDEQAC